MTCGFEPSLKPSPLPEGQRYLSRVLKRPADVEVRNQMRSDSSARLAHAPMLSSRVAPAVPAVPCGGAVLTPHTSHGGCSAGTAPAP